MPSVKEQLLACADLLALPNGWVQGYFAVDIQGDSCLSTDPGAVAFCSRGAMKRIIGEDNFQLYEAARKTLYKVINSNYPGVAGIGWWNDDPSRTQEEVVAAFRKAAELVEE